MISPPPKLDQNKSSVACKKHRAKHDDSIADGFFTVDILGNDGGAGLHARKEV
jgi:hypothetical protein